MKKISILLIVISLAWLVSCDDNDVWKLPTAVNVKMNLLESETDIFEVTAGAITIASIEVEGERNEGDNIYFVRNIASGLSIAFNKESTSKELDFDIPQGIYPRLKISFETYEFDPPINPIGQNDDDDDDEERDDDDGDDEDFIDYYDTEKYNLYVEGYVNLETEDEEIPFRLEVYSPEVFEKVVISTNQDSEVVLNKDIPVTANVTFDADYWFENISEDMWANADILDFDGEPTIVISKFANQEIFMLVVYRIPNSFKIIIE
ncbi:MAG: hypothetical protein PHW82_01090 [Bacteroidales bacterium]|nr:hypothetical protein [Bacteroidales bacterium]